MKVLITGATGFLGEYIIKELNRPEYELFAFGRNENVGKGLENEQTTFIKGDFTAYEEVEAAVAGMDAVIHAGALSTVWGKWESFEQTNIKGTENVLKACSKQGIKRVVYISSPSIYAAKYDRLDIKEEDFDPNNELNYYIKSKILSEQLFEEYPSIDATILRPRGLFGVGDTSIIPRLIKVNQKVGLPLFNQGKNVVDMTCVENVAYAIRLCLENEQAIGKVYNVTNGEPREFKQILEQLFTEIGHKPKYLKLNFSVMYTFASCLEKIYKLFSIYSKEPIFTRYTVSLLGFSQTLNIERIREDLGYEPIVTLDEGIKQYAKANR